MKSRQRERKPPKVLTPFTRGVIAKIRAIPKGKVATYGQIAKLAGKPHGSRGVSWILSSCTRAYGLPWFRVIGSKGSISIPWGTAGFLKQKRLLEGEGVPVAADGRVEMKKFQWKKK